MKIYNIDETSLGNYYKINYILARQLLLIFDSLNQRILDADLNDLDETILETSVYYENKVSYIYNNLPTGWGYYLSQSERHETILDFVNWFFKHKQQPINYLISGVIKHRSEKRSPIKEDYTSTSTEYGKAPLDIEDKKGRLLSRTFNRF